MKKNAKSASKKKTAFRRVEAGGHRALSRRFAAMRLGPLGFWAVYGLSILALASAPSAWLTQGIQRGMLPLSRHAVIRCRGRKAKPDDGDKRMQECMANPTYECVIAAAMSAAQNVDVSIRIGALCFVIKSQAVHGDRQEMWNTISAAVSIAHGFECAGSRELNLRAFAETLAEVGNMKGALYCVQMIDHSRRTEAMHAISTTQIKSGNTEGASYRDKRAEFVRASAVAKVATAMAQMNHRGRQDGREKISSAVFAARNIGNVEERARALCAIVETSGFIRSGGAYTRDEALCATAEVQAESGDVEGSVLIARSVNDRNKRIRVLESIAAARVRAQSEYVRIGDVFILCDIAVAQAEVDFSGARDTFAFALSSAHKLENDDDRTLALCIIAEAQAKKEDIAAALSTAQGCAEALCSIAKVQAKAGNFKDAMRTALGITMDDYVRTEALADIAKHLAARERN